jgi:phosphogluconate dehydratase
MKRNLLLVSLIPDLSASRVGTGREMFSALREKLSGAEQGATCITF